MRTGLEVATALGIALAGTFSSRRWFARGEVCECPLEERTRRFDPSSGKRGRHGDEGKQGWAANANPCFL